MSLLAALQLVSFDSILVGRLVLILHFFTGTHSVIAIRASNDSVTHVKCIFNEGSLAIGCLIVLTSMVKEITYCIAQQQDSNVSASDAPIFRACKAKSADAGRYWLHVYDIERDERISALPAVVSEMLLDPCPIVTVSRRPKCRVLNFQVCIPFFIASMYSPASKDGGN